MGPFRLLDLSGIDICYYVKNGRFQEAGDSAYAPSPLPHRHRSRPAQSPSRVYVWVRGSYICGGANEGLGRRPDGVPTVRGGTCGQLSSAAAGLHGASRRGWPWRIATSHRAARRTQCRPRLGAPGSRALAGSGRRRTPPVSRGLDACAGVRAVPVRAGCRVRSRAKPDPMRSIERAHRPLVALVPRQKEYCGSLTVDVIER